MRAIDRFIYNAKQKFGDKFDYSLIEYVNAKTLVKIVCPVHGVYEQTPDKHLQSTHGCSKCSLELKSKPKRRVCKKRKTDEVYCKLDTKHDLAGTTHHFNLNSVLIDCPVHGKEETTRAKLANRVYSCSKCSQLNRDSKRTHDTERVLKEFNDIHGEYSYDLTNYKYKQSLITVFCKKHGEFRLRATKHLSGQGCSKCNIEQLVKSGKLAGGYNFETIYNSYGLTKPCTLYYLKVGNHYKIGISTNFKQRLKSIKSSSKKSVDILCKIDTTLYDAWLTEDFILRLFDDYRVYHRWSTELFATDVLGNSEMSLDDCMKSAKMYSALIRPP
jgi:Protein of unknown function (DUF723)